MQILIRHPNTRSVDGETYDSPFFEIEGTNPVDSPPDFTPDEDVQLGDVFYYRYKGNSAKSRLWIWRFDAVQGVRNWKRVKIGQRREDGRRLTLSESRKNPSWVSKAWFARRGIQSMYTYLPSPRSRADQYLQIVFSILFCLAV